MTEQPKRRFEKHVAIKAIDEDERTATGIVLTPNELDHQLDFVTPEGVEAMYNPTPEDGVMHAAFPEDAAELEFNEVLEDDQEIDGVEFEAGDWVIRRKYHDDELWSFVGEVLHGFSIGGQVVEADEYDSIADLPDEVEIPDDVDPDATPDKYWPPTGIRNGAVGEISDVDIPAVSSAVYATSKGREKNLYENAGSRDEFVDLMTARGAPEDRAGELYDYLEALEKTTSADAVSKFFDGAAKYHEQKMTDDNQPDPDADAPDLDNFGAHKSFQDVDDATLGQRLKALLFGDPTEPDDGDGETKSLEVSGVTFAKAGDVATDVVKEGRTLNATNRETLMAAHDAIEAALASDMDIETNRFTDDPDTDFDITQFGDPGTDDSEGDEKAAPLEKLTEEQGDLVVGAIQRFVDNQGEASFEEFRDWVWQTDILDDDTTFAADEAAWEYESYVRERTNEQPVTEDFADWVASESNTDTEITMSDDTTEEPPEWAKGLTDRIDSIEEKLSNEEDEPDGSEKGLEDAPEWAQDLTEKVDELDERVDKVATDKADTQQAGGGDGGEGGDGPSDDAEAFKAALGGAN